MIALRWQGCSLKNRQLIVWGLGLPNEKPMIDRLNHGFLKGMHYQQE